MQNGLSMDAGGSLLCGANSGDLGAPLSRQPKAASAMMAKVAERRAQAFETIAGIIGAHS